MKLEHPLMQYLLQQHFPNYLPEPPKNIKNLGSGDFLLSKEKITSNGLVMRIEYYSKCRTIVRWWKLGSPNKEYYPHI
jgi:hypothetical protein